MMMMEMDQNFLFLFFGLRRSFGLHFSLWVGIFQSKDAGMVRRRDARMRIIRVVGNPRYVIPMPAVALPRAVARDRMAMFFVDCFPLLVGFSVKIAVLITPQYEDSLMASTIFPIRKKGVVWARV